MPQGYPEGEFISPFSGIFNGRIRVSVRDHRDFAAMSVACPQPKLALERERSRRPICFVAPGSEFVLSVKRR
jgi:hypothetical protein